MKEIHNAICKSNELSTICQKLRSWEKIFYVMKIFVISRTCTAVRVPFNIKKELYCTKHEFHWYKVLIINYNQEYGSWVLWTVGQVFENEIFEHSQSNLLGDYFSNLFQLYSKFCHKNARQLFVCLLLFALLFPFLFMSNFVGII